MIDIIKSEFQKSKRTSINKFIIITPLLALLFSFSWGGGQNGAYNWWYTMFLPGMLAIISSQVIIMEKKVGYKGILLYPTDKKDIWLGKIIYISILTIITSLIFMMGIIIIGFVDEPVIPLKANILATIILIITFLFQIPMSLFLTARFNMFVTVLFNIGMTIFGVVNFGTNSFLKFSPYGIISSLMCPILKILPNGLPVPENSPLLNGNTILRDIFINIVAFLILTILTTIWFKKKEVN
ncbi:lantibiotic immunity ABC transporter MutE/EpiE family permease subunit [Tissierella sp. MB52-C2]|uniref:lantibiotic immunity ABC transporter MutE/EpiE family permease subunit n=1 Tax=Tissierella sp. MB52-C2 TaxID=3070999 RepID=UPI00280BD393|nr:lantibiotic immunity ABC transporter MutE/EpiE family permease subunit [Tissierella sp. MB52-C2]WMM24145.1 lantibiotic immunity ABC transporter MutE/EpiE family permease subunit [Tissierella sp. MB52-C2]